MDNWITVADDWSTHSVTSLNTESNDINRKISKPFLNCVNWSNLFRNAKKNVVIDQTRCVVSANDKFIQFNARKKIIKRSTNVFERKHSDKMILL